MRVPSGKGFVVKNRLESSVVGEYLQVLNLWITMFRDVWL